MVINKIFNGGLNSDDSPMAMPPGDYLNALNISITDDVDGKMGLVRQATGRDVSIASIVPEDHSLGTTTPVKVISDESQGMIFEFFISDSVAGGNYRGIKAFDTLTNFSYDVWNMSNTVEPTGDTDHIFNTYVDAKVIGDYLIWLNESGKQYRINWKAAVNYNFPGTYTGIDVEYPSSGINMLDMRLIKRPPVIPIGVEKDIDAGVTYNFVKGEAWQFAYRFNYDGSYSVLSPWSHPVNVNTDAENTAGYNNIILTVPLTETLTKEMTSIEVVSRKAFTGAWNIIKTWTSVSDETAIDNHIAGTTALSFAFYNDTTGESLDLATAIKQSDSVPIESYALEVAKNRVFLGDNLEGYDTPPETSLACTVIQSAIGSSLTGQQVVRVDFEYYNTATFVTTYYAAYCFLLTGISSSGYFIINGTSADSTSGAPSLAAVPAGPFDINTDVEFYGMTLSQFCNIVGYQSYPGQVRMSFSEADVPATTRTVDGLDTNNFRPFKSDSIYQIGVQFYDPYLRKCGVLTNDTLKVSVPDRDVSGSSFNQTIDWTLSNTGALTEIPDWAKYYSIVRTDNLSTRYFVQAGTTNVVFYVTYDTNNVYQFVETNKTFSATATVAVAVSTESLTKDGLGYTYTEGDILKLYNSIGGAVPPVHELQIIGTDGKYVLAQAKDIGMATAPTYDDFLFEIRTPYKPSTTEPYYETGDIFPVTDWGTSSRVYSELLGHLSGDCYITSALERMSPNDLFYNKWVKDLGRSCFIDSIGQKRKKNSVRWSNTFIPGTSVNGFNSFDVLDEKDLPVELGGVNKLQLTSKVQSEGTVMLAIGTNNTASLYLGETTVVDNSGQSLIASSGQVIGSVNVLKGKFGTTVPESVVEYDGSVMWVDIINNQVVRYSTNGLFPISSLKMNTFFKTLIKKYKANYNAYNKLLYPLFTAGYNPVSNKYVLSLPVISESQTTIADSSGSYRKSDIHNMYRTSTEGKTIGYDVINERWDSFYSYSGLYTNMSGVMYSASSHVLYIHNIDAAKLGAHFISFRVNEAPKNIKIFHAISTESSVSPSGAQVETFEPNSQITTLATGDFEPEEEVYYSPLYRDRISPNVSGTADEKMYKGDKIRGYYADIALAFGSSATSTDMREVNINVKDSIGHKITSNV